MNKYVKIGVAAAALSAVVPAFAEEAAAEVEVEEEGAIGWTPVAVGLASPVQLPWGCHKWDVYGLNLGLFWSDAPKVYGLDITGLASATRDDLCGMKITAFCNWNDVDVERKSSAKGSNVFPDCLMVRLHFAGS